MKSEELAMLPDVASVRESVAVKECGGTVAMLLQTTSAFPVVVETSLARANSAVPANQNHPFVHKKRARMLTCVNCMQETENENENETWRKFGYVHGVQIFLCAFHLCFGWGMDLREVQPCGECRQVTRVACHVA